MGTTIQVNFFDIVEIFPRISDMTDEELVSQDEIPIALAFQARATARIVDREILKRISTFLKDKEELG